MQDDEICFKQEGYIILIRIFHGKIQFGGKEMDNGIILNLKWILEGYIVGW
jgi:hypothetical protein